MVLAINNKEELEPGFSEFLKDKIFLGKERYLNKYFELIVSRKQQSKSNLDSGVTSNARRSQSIWPTAKVLARSKCDTGSIRNYSEQGSASTITISGVTRTS